MTLLEAISPTSRVILAENSPAMMDVMHDVFELLKKTKDKAAASDWTIDYKLAWLTGRVGDIANTTRRRDAVRHAACAAVAWLASQHLSDMDILSRIAEERIRQRKLFAAREHSFRVDSPIVDWTRKLRMLVKEVGGVAAAIDRLEKSPRSKDFKRHFIQELVQVAAVAVAWLESFEVES